MDNVYRTQYLSVFDDADYKAAIKNSDENQRLVLEAKAREIDDIHCKILEISSKENAYDVFICYKETDEDGNPIDDGSPKEGDKVAPGKKVNEDGEVEAINKGTATITVTISEMSASMTVEVGDGSLMPSLEFENYFNDVVTIANGSSINLGAYVKFNSKRFDDCVIEYSLDDIGMFDFELLEHPF